MFDLRNASIELHSPRCLLRVLEESEVTERYVSWLNDPQINRFLEARFATHSIDSVRNAVRHYRQSGTEVLFGVFFKGSSNEHIGNIKVADIDRNNGVAEIGFLIGDSRYWSRGIASEVIRSVCAWAFQELGLEKITAGAHAENIGSEKALMKAGFVHEATLRSHAFVEGESRTDVHRYAKFAPRDKPR